MQILQEIVITPLLETDAVREQLPVYEASDLDFARVFESIAPTVESTEMTDTGVAITLDLPEQEELGSDLEAPFVAEEITEPAQVPVIAAPSKESVVSPEDRDINRAEPLENDLSVVEELDSTPIQSVPIVHAHLQLVHQHSKTAGKPNVGTPKVEGLDNSHKTLVGEHVKGDATRPQTPVLNLQIADVRPAALDVSSPLQAQGIVKPELSNLPGTESIIRTQPERYVLPEASVAALYAKIENNPRRGSDLLPERRSFTTSQPATPPAQSAYQLDAKPNEAQQNPQDAKSIQSELPLKFTQPITAPVPTEPNFKLPPMVNVSPNSGQVAQFPAAAVSQQIAIAVHQTSGGSTDIALNPEELGRVRLSMTSVDGTMMLAVATERAETQDLIRRHIETLAQEMRALGYRDVGFSFEGDQSAAGKEWLSENEAPYEEDVDNGTQEIESTYIIASGLDLRL